MLSSHSQEIKEYNRAALDHYIAAEYEQAIAAYSKVIQLDPDNVAAYIDCAHVYKEIGDGEAACDLADQAMSIDPTSQMVYDFFIKFYSSYPDSFYFIIEFLTESIAAHPKLAFLYLERGFAYGFSLQFDEALKDLEKAIELNPMDSTAYFCRSQIYSYMGQYEQAFADIDLAIKLMPGNLVYLFARADFHAEEKYFYRAAREYISIMNNCSEPELCEDLYDKEKYGELLQLLMEYDVLSHHQACVYGLSLEDQRFKQVTVEINVILKAMNSLDSLKTPASLFHQVGLFVNNHQARFEKERAGIIPDIQEKLDGLLPHVLEIKRS